MVSLRGLHGLCVRSGALSCLTLVTPWTVPHQTALSMGFPRQEYWSGLPFPIPGDFPNPGIELISPALAGRFFTTSNTWEALVNVSWGGKEQNLWCEVAKVLPWPSHHLSQRPLVSPWSSLGLTPCWDGVVLYCLFAQDDWP